MLALTKKQVLKVRPGTGDRMTAIPNRSPQSAYTDAQIAAMVQDGRVHSRIYTDPAIFELELERIYTRIWIYVGHESEIPNSGDYVMRDIGRTPVLLARGADGQARVLVNRCRHRGAQVVETEAGNVPNFRCWYHGWTFDTSGALIGLTGPDAYGKDFKVADMGLNEVPRVANYRGFIFGSLATDGESLEAFLGRAAAMIDLLVDASPTGEIIADGGTHKTVYNGNWKLIGMDGYHPHYTHASVIAAMHRKPEAGIAATHREDPFLDKARTRTRDFGHGHAMLDFRDHRAHQYEQNAAFIRKIPGGDAYIEAMLAKHGAAGKMLVSLAGDPHLGIFPNMQLINNQIRIITPLAADRTRVSMTAVRLGGVSPEMNAVRMRQHESFYGPAGSGSPDDAEIFERVQLGMQAEVNPWLEISRGMERQTVDADGSIVGLISDEVPQRGMMRYWSELMARPA